MKRYHQVLIASNTRCLPEIAWSFISTLDRAERASWDFSQNQGGSGTDGKMTDSLKGNRGNMQNLEMP